MPKDTVDREGSELVPIFLRLPEAQIVLLKFLLESYEGLAVVRTLNAARGEVVVLALRDTEAEARAVVKDLAKDIQLVEIPRPADMSGDWLLSS